MWWSEPGGEEGGGEGGEVEGGQGEELQGGGGEGDGLHVVRGGGYMQQGGQVFGGEPRTTQVQAGQAAGGIAQ